MTFLTKITIPSILCVIAGILWLLFQKKLSKTERVITLIIWLNIGSDLIAAKLSTEGITNGFVYNILAPIERILTVYIYIRCSNFLKSKYLHIIGLCAIILVSAISQIHAQDFSAFQNISFVIGGLVVSLLSYYHLRNITLGRAKDDFLIALFAVANLIYYTLMSSSISAFYAALDVSRAFARDIYSINQFAYGLWAITLSIGLLWSKRKT